MHRFSSQLWLRKFIRESRATQLSPKVSGSDGKLLEELH